MFGIRIGGIVGFGVWLLRSARVDVMKRGLSFGLGLRMWLGGRFSLWLGLGLVLWKMSATVFSGPRMSEGKCPIFVSWMLTLSGRDQSALFLSGHDPRSSVVIPHLPASLPLHPGSHTIADTCGWGLSNNNNNNDDDNDRAIRAMSSSVIVCRRVHIWLLYERRQCEIDGVRTFDPEQSSPVPQRISAVPRGQLRYNTHTFVFHHNCYSKRRNTIKYGTIWRRETR